MAEVVLFDKILGLGTLLLQIAIITLVISYFYYKNKHQSRIYKEVTKFVRQNSILLAFLIVLSGTIFSLIYSNIIGYAACELCWYQRILIYPQVIILGVALIKKQKNIFDYVIGLNILGLIIAVYQYYLQMSGNNTACGTTGILCSSIYVLEFGYITIPMMSITLFISLIFLTYIWKHERKQNPRIEIEHL